MIRFYIQVRLGDRYCNILREENLRGQVERKLITCENLRQLNEKINGYYADYPNAVVEILHTEELPRSMF